MLLFNFHSPCRTATHSIPAPSANPTAAQITDASGPKLPPVSQKGPCSEACTSALRSAAFPDTWVPYTGPSKKFHAQWIPIGSHKRRVVI